MKIQLVYFEGCPNVDATREILRSAVASSGKSVRIEEVRTSDPGTPVSLRNWGSPTILIDGVDLCAERPSGRLGCRLYRGPSGRLHGVPPMTLIEQSLRSARLA